MPTTIIGPPSLQPIIRDVKAPVVYIKEAWSDAWRYESELRVENASACTASHDLGMCELKRNYGSAKEPYETALSTKLPFDLHGWWVKVEFATENGTMIAFQGQIPDSARNIFGSDVARTGEQNWVAYAPMFLLMKKYISESYWDVDSAAVLLGWIPDMNRRGYKGRLIGNRTAAKLGNTYLYGGYSTWTHRDALEYILDRFCDESGSSGPEWRVGGQADLLDDITSVIHFGTTQSVYEVLMRIISPRHGIDYKIVPWADGFEVFVYALVADDYSFESATLPRNPNKIRVKSSEMHDMPLVEIVKSSDQRYGKIRLIGARIVIVATLQGADLEGKWTSTKETPYKAGTGTPADTAEAHDAARARDYYRAVYQAFAAPSAWYTQALELDAGGKDTGGLAAEYQNVVRSTLPWMPLREGYDYEGGLEWNQNPSGYEADFLPPMVWLYDLGEGGDLLRHVRAESRGVGVSALENDWGVLLSASPNHLLALNHFAGAEDTEVEPVYDWGDMVVTFAFEADKRLVVQHEVPGGDESVKDIPVPWAQLWYISPDTVVGIDELGDVQTVGKKGYVIRNDAENGELDFLMAGAIARYGYTRARATITLKGLHAWQDLLGHILTVVEEAGDTEPVQAPVTSVSWVFGDDPQTIIRAGRAS